MFSVEGKTILVTGASSGIGREVSIHLSKFGANIILVGRDAEKLNHTFNCLVSESSRNNKYYICDLCEENNIKQLTEKIKSLDCLIHCAGIGKYIPLKFYNSSILNEFYNINLFAPLLLTKELVKGRKINTEGSVIFISSIMSVIGAKANGIYASTKSALVGATKSIALELSTNRIRVNCISPALVKTPLLDSGLDKGGISQSEYDIDLLNHPLGIGKPSDVANLCHYLISDEARWITGTNIIIDGGYTLR